MGGHNTNSGLALLVSGNRELAEEALQEAWLGLMEGLERFDPAKGSPRGWFLGGG